MSKKTTKPVAQKVQKENTDKGWIVWVVFWAGLFTFLTVVAIVGGGSNG